MDVDASVGGDVADADAAAEEGLAVTDAEGVAGLLVEVGEYAVGIVEDHVGQGGVEHGVVAQCALAGLGLAAGLEGDVAGGADEGLGAAFLVAHQD